MNNKTDIEQHPVSKVKWVSSELIVANDYNPNKVAPPEMELLQISIESDGYTQPIVVWQREDKKYEVIDGFHRHIVGKYKLEKVVARVNGVNSGALYIQENGNMTGYNKITKPDGHTWKSFCNLLLRTMPKKTREHYFLRFKKFISGWRDRGYNTIPDEAPIELENKCWCPSWRRMCKCILRNDYWCKGLGQTQPLSEAYKKFKEIKKLRQNN